MEMTAGAAAESIDPLTKGSVAAAAAVSLSTGPQPPIGTNRRRIYAPRPPPTVSTAVPAALPKLESQVFDCPIRPSPKSPALQGETAVKPLSHAVALVLSSSDADATLEFLNYLKSVSSKKDLNLLQKFNKLFILLCVDKEFTAVTEKIIEETTRRRVERDLSNNKSATLKINDLDKLDGFLSWPWKDIQKRLKKIKKLKFIIYVKKDGQLAEAIKALHLDRVYLLGDIECDTVEDRCTVLTVGTFHVEEKDCLGGPLRRHIDGSQS